MDISEYFPIVVDGLLGICGLLAFSIVCLVVFANMLSSQVSRREGR